MSRCGAGVKLAVECGVVHGEGCREPETREAGQMCHGNTVSLTFVGLWGRFCVRARWLDP